VIGLLAALPADSPSESNPTYHSAISDRRLPSFPFGNDGSGCLRREPERLCLFGDTQFSMESSISLLLADRALIADCCVQVNSRGFSLQPMTYTAKAGRQQTKGYPEFWDTVSRRITPLLAFTAPGRDHQFSPGRPSGPFVAALLPGRTT